MYFIFKNAGKFLKWEYYRDLYNKDCAVDPIANLRSVPKLTVNHIRLSPQMKMRVFLAVQV